MADILRGAPRGWTAPWHMTTAEADARADLVWRWGMSFALPEWFFANKYRIQLYLDQMARMQAETEQQLQALAGPCTVAMNYSYCHAPVYKMDADPIFGHPVFGRCPGLTITVNVYTPAPQ